MRCVLHTEYLYILMVKQEEDAETGIIAKKNVTKMETRNVGTKRQVPNMVYQSSSKILKHNYLSFKNAVLMVLDECLTA